MRERLDGSPIHGENRPAAGATADVVLHVRVISATAGGPDKTILASAVPLRQTRYRVRAAYLHAPRDPGFLAVERRARAYGCHLISVPERVPFDPRQLGRLLGICRRLGVRIWHGHDYKSNLFGLMLRHFAPMTLVTTAHGWVKHTRRTRLYYAVDRLCLPRYDHIIAVSPDLHERILKLGVPPARCTLLANAIDEEQFRRRSPAAEAPLRRQLSVPGGRFVIGAAGRLSREKGFDLLIRAVARSRASGLDVELWIAGAGEEETALRALGRELGLAERLRILGFVEDMVELYDALDVFVLSSRREGLPNVVLEAMAMGVPVLATNIAGVPVVIRNGENGLLCAAGDDSALAAGIERLLGDAALRSALAGAGRRTIEDRFRFAARIAAETDIYDRLLDRA